MRILSPAKINLHLRVAPPAADGFHPILSWMTTIGLHDSLEITDSPKPGIRLRCDHPNVPLDATNLIIRAGQALGGHLGAQVTLDKQIPIGGGLGGGSSNAAFALIGFNQIWNLKFETPRLAEIAARLGSDIVFFLHGPSSICTGRGERVMPIPKPTPKFAVLFLPKLSMPTPAVYRKFDEMRLGSDLDIHHHPDWSAWANLPARELMKLLVNDLESPAFAISPELANLRTHIEQKIAQTVRMSGSGSTLFTLADSQDDADAIVRHSNSTDSIATMVTPLAPELGALGALGG